MNYAVHIFNRDGASHDQTYCGPFRSFKAAERFAERVQTRIESAGSDFDATCGAEVIVLEPPRIGPLADHGWFD